MNLFFFSLWCLLHPCLAAEATLSTCHVFQLISGSLLPWLLEVTKQYLICFNRYAKQGCCSPWSSAGLLFLHVWDPREPRAAPGALGSWGEAAVLEPSGISTGNPRDWGRSGS